MPFAFLADSPVAVRARHAAPELAEGEVTLHGVGARPTGDVGDLEEEVLGVRADRDIHTARAVGRGHAQRRRGGGAVVRRRDLTGAV